VADLGSKETDELVPSGSRWGLGQREMGLTEQLCNFEKLLKAQSPHPGVTVTQELPHTQALTPGSPPLHTHILEVYEMSPE
jgi:hypothetical protein